MLFPKLDIVDKIAITTGTIVIIALLIVLMYTGCSNNQDHPPSDNIEDSEPMQVSPKVHFSIDYDNDIKSDPLFDTEDERDSYRNIGIGYMEKIYSDFYNKFKFEPQHQIHIIISETINGSKSVAYASKQYDYTGKILKLTMHFPYEMFNHESVRAHELTHSFVAPFYLPTWADEGFAVLQGNLYTDIPSHPILDLHSNIRYDGEGINAVQNWKEWQGIYSDGNLTEWCYSYSHSIIAYIENKWPGTMQNVFNKIHPHNTLSSDAFVTILDNIIKDDMFKFFEDLGFKFNIIERSSH